MTTYTKNYMKPSNIKLDQQLDKLVVNFSGVPFQSKAIIGENEFTLGETVTRSSPAGGGLIIADSSKSNDYKFNFNISDENSLNFFKNFDNTISCISTSYNEDIENYTFDIKIDIENDSGTKTIFSKSSLNGSEPVILSKELFNDITAISNQFLFIYLNNVKSSDINYGLVLSISNENTITLPKETYPNGNYTVQLIGIYGDNTFTNSFVVTTKYGNIILYNCKSDNNVLVKDIEEIVTMEGFYRSSVSVLNPVITVEIDNPYKDFALAPNYLYNKDFDRYYYINDITMLRKGVWELSCQVDVLMSFKDEITELSAYILRQENDFNKLIPDRQLPLFQQPDISFIQGSDTKLKSPLTMNNSQYCYTLTVMSTQTKAGDLDIKQVSTPSYVTHNTRVGVMSYACVNDISDLLIRQNITNIGYLLEGQPAQYIINILMYPYTFSAEDGVELGFKGNEFGNLIIGQVTNQIINHPIGYISKTPDFLISGGHIDFNQRENDLLFLDYYPYSSITIFIPFYGFYEINPNVCWDKSLCVVYSVNLINGDAKIYLNYRKFNIEFGSIRFITTSLSTVKNYESNPNYTITEIDIKTYYKDEPILIADTNIVSEIPIGSSNWLEIGKKSILSAAKLSLGVMGSGSNFSDKMNEYNMSKMSTKKKARFLARAEGEYHKELRNEFSEFGQDIASLQLSMNSGGVTQGDWSSMVGQLNMVARIIKPKKVLTDVLNYRHYNGQPLCDSRILKNIHGYTLVGAIHVENLGNAVADEKEEVENILRSGVILP